MNEQPKILSRNEAQQVLKNDKRVQFHWRDQVVEITLNTTLDDLRWVLKARLKLLVSDVINGQYSIIE